MKNDEINNSGFLLSNEESISSNFSNYCELTSRGFNKIYKAKRYGKWHILKGLKEPFCNDETYRNWLQKEFELCVNLNHPNIVTVMTLEDVPELGPCIVMEYVDGVTLDVFLQTSPPAATLSKILSEILSAMQYYHSRQIIHRDLKPSNILITRNGNNVKIIDFGFADADFYAQLKQPAGTLSYAAPEQLTEGADIDCRADLYAFGKILEYHFPRQYRYLARRCTQKQPFQRPANANAVLQLLEKRPKRMLILIFCLVISIFAILLFLMRHFKTEMDDEYLRQVNENETYGLVEDSSKKLETIPEKESISPSQQMVEDDGSTIIKQMEQEMERHYQVFMGQLKTSDYPNDAVPRMLTWNCSQQAEKDIVRPILEKIPQNSDLYLKIWEHFMILRQKYEQQCFKICEKWISVRKMRNILDERREKGEISNIQYDKIVDSLQLNECLNWKLNEKTMMYERK